MVSKQKREYEARKLEEGSDTEEKGKKTAVCGMRNLVCRETHNMCCQG